MHRVSLTSVPMALPWHVGYSSHGLRLVWAASSLATQTRERAHVHIRACVHTYTLSHTLTFVDACVCLTSYAFESNLKPYY